MATSYLVDEEETNNGYEEENREATLHHEGYILDEEENREETLHHEGYILGADFGSTTLTVKIYDLKAHVVATSAVKVPYVDLPKGALEIDPVKLYNLFVETVKELLLRSNIDAGKIKSTGFSFQRGSFVLWNKESGEPRCNLISWQDTRCADVVEEMNQCYMKKAINIVGTIAYSLCRSTRFLLLKVLQFQVGHGSMKLLWLLKNDPQLHEDINNGKVLYGTMDTWIVWKLTNGGMHVTDFTCASGTAMFDPYICQWSSIMPVMCKISLDMCPTVVDTSGFIANTEKDIFGASIPISAIVADVQAGVFGLNCYTPGQFCCLMGTGCFLAINTGSYAHASIAGLYPQVGWKCGEDLTYTCEGNITGIAASIEWAREIGMFDDVTLMSDIAKSTQDTDGVYFVPGFSGLSAPHNDPMACAGLIGIRRNTSKAHIVRAILEGIAFRFLELYHVAKDETKMPFQSPIKVSGGISNNEFVMELISSLTDCTVEKANDSDVSLTGAVYLAGLGAGIWKNKEEICNLPKSAITFEPDPLVHDKYIDIHKQWLKAVRRCMYWHT